MNGGGPPNSEQLKLTERFTRVDPEMIEYRATVNDPGAYAAPFTIRLMITSRPGYEMYEYSCHEGNGAVHNALIGRARVREAGRRGEGEGPAARRRARSSTIKSGTACRGKARLFNINAGE